MLVCRFDDDCRAQFSDVEALSEHLHAHLDYRPFKCLYCPDDRRFTSAKTHQDHAQQTHPENCQYEYDADIVKRRMLTAQIERAKTPIQLDADREVEVKREESAACLSMLPSTSEMPMEETNETDELLAADLPEDDDQVIICAKCHELWQPVAVPLQQVNRQMRFRHTLLHMQMDMLVNVCSLETAISEHRSKFLAEYALCFGRNRPRSQLASSSTPEPPVNVRDSVWDGSGASTGDSPSHSASTSGTLQAPTSRVTSHAVSNNKATSYSVISYGKAPFKTLECTICKARVSIGAIVRHIYCEHVKSLLVRCPATLCTFGHYYDYETVAVHIREQHADSSNLKPIDDRFVEEKRARQLMREYFPLCKSMFERPSANIGRLAVGGDAVQSGDNLTLTDRLSAIFSTVIQPPASPQVSSSTTVIATTRREMTKVQCKRCKKQFPINWISRHIWKELYNERQKARYHCTADGCHFKNDSRKRVATHCSTKHRSGSSLVGDNETKYTKQFRKMSQKCFPNV